MHLAMEPSGQPLHQTRLGARQIDAGDPDLGESEFPGQGLNPNDELMAADHLPIVETAKPLDVPSRTTWHDEADTEAFARALAASPSVRDAFIALHGDLGAGKTTFVRHLLHALGVRGRIKSPTYAVVEPHEAADGLAIFHFDFYRFSDPREWEDAGFRDIFAGPGLKLAEWPDNAAGHLPRADLTLTIESMTDETRNVTLVADTARGMTLLAAAAA
jgi:tRNA threonylcarbamoyladenosine biosynthesis protein TsaE